MKAALQQTGKTSLTVVLGGIVLLCSQASHAATIADNQQSPPAVQSDVPDPLSAQDESSHADAPPTLVGKAQYLTFLAQPIEPDGDYAQFAATQNTRAPRVYRAANDGTLRAFDSDGNERFTFVPRGPLEQRHEPATHPDRNGAHPRPPGGSPVAADAYFGGAWHSVLIGTGGKGLYALDVTDPGHIRLLWELGVEREPDLGQGIPKPTVARLHNGKWAVAVGNGYASPSGQAALLIIDLETGGITRKLQVAGQPGMPNGLSSPRLADNNSDGVADYAYAGDLQGNLWRFDLIASQVSQDAPFSRVNDGPAVASSFKVSFGGKPLYSAIDPSGAAQAITASPSLVRHPTRRGYIVIFGTGNGFETHDDGSLIQTLYGIWDRQTKGEAASGTPNLTRADLQRQTLDQQADSTFGSATRAVRIASQNPLHWLDDKGSTIQYGWYLDFMVKGKPEGERLVEDMIALGQLLLLRTNAPNDAPGARQWTYGIDPHSGGRTRFTVFDLARQGSVDAASDYRYAQRDVVVSATVQKGQGGLTLSSREPGQPRVCSPVECLAMSAGPATRGRQSWRLIEGQH